MSQTGERLQKLLAAAGLGSRREIEGWISAGRVAVNGKPVELGQRVDSLDGITIDGKPLRRMKSAPALPRVVVYNKPEGEICSRKDPEGRPSVFEQLPRLRDGRWVLVGRLDLNTAGLLLVTDHGELANRLMHPGFGIEREYLVRVNGEVDEAMLARLRKGVQLDDGMAAFDAIAERGGSGRNRWFSVVLREGRNREVRRLWEAEGCTVSRLKRVRFGPVFLGPRDMRGSWRDLDEAGIRQLFALVELAMPAPATEAKPVSDGPAGRKRASRAGAGAGRPRSGPRRAQ
jgi:23S rRNA pseudouridine2605 synthase